MSRERKYFPFEEALSKIADFLEVKADELRAAYNQAAENFGDTGRQDKKSKAANSQPASSQAANPSAADEKSTAPVLPLADGDSRIIHAVRKWGYRKSFNENTFEMNMLCGEPLRLEFYDSHISANDGKACQMDREKAPLGVFVSKSEYQNEKNELKCKIRVARHFSALKQASWDEIVLDPQSRPPTPKHKTSFRRHRP